MPTSELTKAINGLSTENRTFVEKMVFLLIAEQNAEGKSIDGTNSKYYRHPGIMHGKIYMSEDFDDPLDDMKGYM